MSEFIYLYRGGERPESPSEGEKQMQRWVAWLQELGTSGHLKDRGQPLENEGKVVRKQRTITDGPYPDVAIGDRVTGRQRSGVDAVRVSSALHRTAPKTKK